MSEPISNVAEYSVSEISMALKRTIESTFGYVRVRGEISGYRGPHASGHAYFSLKDDKSRIEAVIWRTSLQKLRFRPEEGMEVIATGRLTTFPGSSKYQIVIDALEPAGVGALMALLEERRKKLAAEGLFDPARKKPIPYLPRTIGVITSPTGAVIHDILHRLSDRFPVRVIVWPVRVQGETSAAEVAAAINGFNAATTLFPRPDVLIVARGGGSLEDLWGFNEEIVVRAAAASKIPLISAVGHETDVTLIDHASDKRAPTPTGAAEMAVPVRSELLAALDGCARRHIGALARLFDLRRRELRAAERALPGAAEILDIPRRSLDEVASRLGRSLHANTLAHRSAFGQASALLSIGRLDVLVGRSKERLGAMTARKLQALDVNLERKAALLAASLRRFRPDAISERLLAARQRLGEIDGRGRQAAQRMIEQRQERLDAVMRLLDTVSYRSILARGFALVHGADGMPVREAAGVATGATLDLEFADGRVRAMATEAPRPRASTRGRPKRATASPEQGSLL